VFSGGTVYFFGAEFSGGNVLFGEGVFSGGTVYFFGAKFSGGNVFFGNAKFSSGKVDFRDPGDWSFPPKFLWTATLPGVLLPNQGQSQT